MKFQKGLLSDLVPEANEPKNKEEQPSPAIRLENPTDKAHQAARTLPESAVNDHLFDTLREKSGSERNYLKLFGFVVAGVILAGIAVFYITLPGIGDAVRGSTELELAVRDHFLTVQKRTATDITFYQCDGYYGARVGVETRTDLPNPVFRIGTYSARAVDRGGQWEITAAPITPPAQFTPCQ
jgi:hypothetical protein